MARTTIVVDYNVMREELIFKLQAGIGGAKMDQIMKENFETAKRNLFNRFYKDKRTQDLINGPRKTKLWGFLGFDNATNSDPMDEIINLLNEGIALDNFGTRSGNFRRVYEVSTPIESQLRSVTQLPEIGASWLDVLESGEAVGRVNFAYRLNKKGSRSKAGLQYAGPVPSGPYKIPRGPYLLSFIKEFRRELGAG